MSDEETQNEESGTEEAAPVEASEGASEESASTEVEAPEEASDEEVPVKKKDGKNPLDEKKVEVDESNHGLDVSVGDELELLGKPFFIKEVTALTIVLCRKDIK